MKKIIFLIALSIISGLCLKAQERAFKIPEVQIKDIDGASFNTASIDNEGKPIVISFWATWCSPCKRELNAISEIYDEWQEETGVKLVAVSIDDSRNVQKVKPYINGQAWEFEVLIDQNHDLKRAMNVNNVPHTFLLDGNGNIVYQHNSYSPGDEDKLYAMIQQLVQNGKID